MLAVFLWPATSFLGLLAAACSAIDSPPTSATNRDIAETPARTLIVVDRIDCMSRELNLSRHLPLKDSAGYALYFSCYT